MNIDAKVKQLLNKTREEKILEDNPHPVLVVGRLIKAAQELFPQDKDSDFNHIIQQAYIRLLIEDKNFDSVKADQSWRVASGGNFEGYVRNHINDVLNSKGLIAVKGDYLKMLAKRSEKVKTIVKYLTLPAKRKCIRQSVDVWPDNDILVLAKESENSWRVLASISVKTSSHSRNTSVLFWSIAVRELGIKYFLATQDRDNQFVKTCTSKRVNQERRLFEAYCDRVFTANPRASYCSQVKSLIIRDDGTSDLTDELIELKRGEIGEENQYKVAEKDIESY